jgi:hypothetical protein
MAEAPRWLFVVISAPLLVAPGTAGAQATAPPAATEQAEQAEPTEADTLFAAGRELLERGRFAEACEKLKESQRLSPAVGTLLNLGYCWEQLGHHRSALDAYAEADLLATEGGDARRSEFAKERFAAILPRAPRLLLRLAAPSMKGLEVTRDGVVVPPSEWGQRIPVDPADVHIVATAPGKVAWRAVVHVQGEGAVTTVVVPPLADPVADGTSSISTVLGPQRVAAIALGGGALAAFGSGTALALSASARRDDSSHHCDPTGCDDIGNDIRRRASSQGSVATVLFVAGLVSLGAGTILWLSGGRSDVARARFRTFALPGGGAFEATF